MYAYPVIERLKCKEIYKLTGSEAYIAKVQRVIFRKNNVHIVAQILNGTG